MELIELEVTGKIIWIEFRIDLSHVVILYELVYATADALVQDIFIEYVDVWLERIRGHL